MKGQSRVQWDELPLGQLPDVCIAKMTGYNASSVSLARRARGIAAVPRSAITEEDRIKAVALYAEGMSRSEVSKIINISSSYIKDLIRVKGEPRKSGFQLGNNEGARDRPPEERAKLSVAKKTLGQKPTREAIEHSHRNHARTSEDQVYRRYMYVAQKRGLAFQLALEEFTVLLSGNCHYCGDPPGVMKSSSGRLFAANGIDRVDNKLGYSITNSVSCCKWCNRMKSTLGKEQFIEQCRKVARCHGKF